MNRLRWLLVGTMALGACTQQQAPQQIRLPDAARDVKVLEGKSFETGVEFSVDVVSGSYDALSMVERQLLDRGFSGCPQNRSQAWSPGGEQGQMLARTYLNDRANQFAVIRVIQSSRAGEAVAQHFRVAVQRYSPGAKNSKKIAEFCGPG